MSGAREPRLLEFLLIRVEAEKEPELRASLVRVLAGGRASGPTNH